MNSAGSAPESAVSDTALQHYESGSRLLKSEDLNGAEREYSAAIQIAPCFSRALIGLGICQAQQGRLDEALPHFNRALELDPETPLALEWRGSLRFKQGDLEDALRDLARAIQLAPDSASAYLWRGRLWQEMEELEVARADYDQAMRCNPEDGGAYYYRGRLHLDWGDEQAAIEDLTDAIERFPDDDFGRVAAMYCRGAAYRNHEQYSAAIRDFTAVIEAGFWTATTYWQRGETHVLQDQHAAAIADFTAAISHSPADPDFLRSRGKVWDLLGEVHKADLDFEQAWQLEVAESPHSTSMTTAGSKSIYQRWEQHFDLASDEQLLITERAFPSRLRVDVQRGLERLLQSLQIQHFSSLQREHRHEGVGLNDLQIRERHNPPQELSPEYVEVDLKEESPVRCLKSGYWLLERNGVRFALLQRSSRFEGNVISFQLAIRNTPEGVATANAIFEELTRAIREARSYCGKVLSLECGDSCSEESAAIRIHQLNPVTREQVILPEETLQLLERNVIQFVNRRQQLSRLGMSTRKGILFYGPPGTGKTHTLRYLASALPGVTTFLITGGQIGMLRKYMQLARLLQPALVVIEDADLVCRMRNPNTMADEEVVLNTLLNEMDGLQNDAEIIVVLTTNRPEILEPALASRPGRVDQAIEFPYPDAAGREKLLRLYSQGISFSDELLLKTVQRTENVSPAFIKELVRRAVQFQLERDGEQLIWGDIDQALREILIAGGSLNRNLLEAQLAEEVGERDDVPIETS